MSSDGIICKNPGNILLILLGKSKNLMQISFEIGCNYTWKQNDKYLKWSHRKIKWMGIAYELYKKCISKSVWINSNMWILLIEFLCKNSSNFVLIPVEKYKNLMQLSFEIGYNLYMRTKW